MKPMRLLLALGAALGALGAGPAQASLMPVIDLPADTRAVSLGVDPQTVNASFDWAMGDSGWQAGLAGTYDISGARGLRESFTFSALRVARRMGGSYPFSWGLGLSAGMTLVDPTVPLNDPGDRPYTSPYLFWAQPAVMLSTPLFGEMFNDSLWFRASVGPVLNRWTSGVFFLPFISPNLEFAFRVHPSHEVVIGGGNVPWGIGWRGAF